MPERPMPEEFVRQSQLLDQLVLDRATMDECGRIEVMWCYPKVHRVLGFICKSGSFDRTKTAFNLDQLDKIGENGVLVKSEPVETDRDRVRQLESLIGCEVWTDEGKRVGRINDYVFQLSSGNIRYYLLASSGLQGLTGKLYSLYPNQILGYGRGRVMVSGGIVPGLELYQVGLDQKLEEKFTGLEERLERKLKRVADRLNEGMADDAPPVGQELKGRAQSLFDRARSVTSQVSSRARDRAQEFLDERDWASDRLADRRDLDEPRDRRNDDRRDNDREDNDHRDNDREDDVEFDFDDWEEPQNNPIQPNDSSSNQSPSNRESQEPIAQRYSKRSAGFDSGSEPEVETPRPPLNLSAPQVSAPQVSKSTGEFTAKPRPSSNSAPSQEDPWDDDWG